MRYAIAIIGLGNIGRRHLEGLRGLRVESDIYLFDTWKQSLELAKPVASMVQDEIGASIHICDDLSMLPSHIDLAIIATPSRGRAEIVRTIVETFCVSNLILEKVLFDKIEDYDSIRALLSEKGVKAWVNCPRRIWDSYQALRHELEGRTVAEITIAGGNWGMACNSVHYLDLIRYLSGIDNEISIDRALISPEEKASKRPGYQEIDGAIFGHAGETIFSIFDSAEDSKMLITIKVEDEIIVINESAQKIVRWNEDGFCSISEFEVPFQSKIAYKPVQDIFENDICDLSTLEESSETHVAFLGAIEGHFVGLGIPAGEFPIT